MAGPSLPSREAFALTVDTCGGVADLCRVVGVLALYELTPSRLEVQPRGSGLRVEMCLEADEKTRRLCSERIAASTAVVSVLCDLA